MALLLWLVAHDIGWGRVPRLLAQISLGGLAMGLTVYLGRSWNPLLLLASAYLSYAAALVLVGALGREDVALVRSVFEGRFGRRRAGAQPQ
jgi:hypothetical protein